MGITVNFATEAAITFTYEDHEGDECTGNQLELNISASTMDGLLETLGLPRPDEEMGRLPARQVVEAIGSWDGETFLGMLAYKPAPYCHRLMTRLAMIAAACEMRGVEVRWA